MLYAIAVNNFVNLILGQQPTGVLQHGNEEGRRVHRDVEQLHTEHESCRKSVMKKNGTD